MSGRRCGLVSRTPPPKAFARRRSDDVSSDELDELFRLTDDETGAGGVERGVAKAKAKSGPPAGPPPPVPINAPDTPHTGCLCQSMGRYGARSDPCTIWTSSSDGDSDWSSLYAVLFDQYNYPGANDHELSCRRRRWHSYSLRDSGAIGWTTSGVGTTRPAFRCGNRATHSPARPVRSD